MPDYSRLALTAQRLIQAAGRSVTVVQLDQTEADPAKPWRGVVDPRGAGKDSVGPVRAAFVDVASAAKMGIVSVDQDFVKRSEQMLLVAASDDAGKDLAAFHEVVDGSTNWKIQGAQTLKPGDVKLLYVIGVRR